MSSTLTSSVQRTEHVQTPSGVHTTRSTGDTTFKKPSTPFTTAFLTKTIIDYESEAAKAYRPQLNERLFPFISADAQAMIVTIMREEYDVDVKISNYNEGNQSTFLNFLFSTCPICRSCHRNGWSLSNADKYKETTLVFCCKTNTRRLIPRLPF